MENQLVKQQNELNIFQSFESFENAQRIANAISSSDLIPKEYRKNIPNTLVALELAHRTGASPLMVMQNLYIVHGKPSWSSQFIISAINSTGKFKPLRFELKNNGKKDFEYQIFEGFGQNRKKVPKKGKFDDLNCYAYTEDKNGLNLKGTTVTMQMALSEGWVDKDGSKWMTMPELMIQYRAATFFGRLYCPEILNGMQSVDEVIDITYEEVKDNTEKKETEKAENIINKSKEQSIIDFEKESQKNR